MSKATFNTLFKNELAQREFNPKETMQWLTRDKIVTMSWGFHKAKNLMNQGLMFTVNGAIHSGHVLVTLAYNDTYTISLFNKAYNQVGESVKDVYCDELQNIVDLLVETSS